MNTSAKELPKMKKQALYKTAKASISCAAFQAGEYVSVKFDRTDEKGTDWYLIESSQNGKLASPVAYPAHHLESFCL